MTTGCACGETNAELLAKLGNYERSTTLIRLQTWFCVHDTRDVARWRAWIAKFNSSPPTPLSLDAFFFFFLIFQIVLRFYEVISVTFLPCYLNRFQYNRYKSNPHPTPPINVIRTIRLSDGKSRCFGVLPKRVSTSQWFYTARYLIGPETNSCWHQSAGVCLCCVGGNFWNEGP